MARYIINFTTKECKYDQVELEVLDNGIDPIINIINYLLDNKSRLNIDQIFELFREEQDSTNESS